MTTESREPLVSLSDSLWTSLRVSLDDASLRVSLGASLGDSLWASLGDSLWTSLRVSLDDASLRVSLGALRLAQASKKR